MKGLILGVHIVVKTLNLETTRCRLADYVNEIYLSACRTYSTIIFPHLSNQIIFFWRCRCRCRCRRRCLNSLMLGRWRRRQECYKFAYLTMKNSSFAHFARARFKFVHFAAVLILSTTWNELFCDCVDDVSTSFTKRLTLILIQSRIIISRFASQME